MQQPVSIIRGTSKTFALKLTDADGCAYELHDGEVLRLGVKVRPGDEEYLIEKEVTSGEDGEYLFDLVPADTAELEYAKYCYDIGLQSGTDYYNVVEFSPFSVTYNVTDRG